MKNKIEDLRNHLFMALEGLGDKDAPMDIARAKAIADVAQTIINSAKVEVDYINAMGSKAMPTNFIEHQPEVRTPLRAIEGKRQA